MDRGPKDMRAPGLQHGRAWMFPLWRAQHGIESMCRDTWHGQQRNPQG